MMANKAQRQGSLFSFGVTASSSRQTEESVIPPPKSAGVKRKYEETNRQRKFLPEWKKEFSWVSFDEEKQLMSCTVCCDHPSIADKAGGFFEGTNSFRKGNLQAHDQSSKHQECVNASKPALILHQGPLPALIMRMEAGLQEQMSILFYTAYHIAKTELPFTAYPSMLKLQRKNRLEVGEAYLTARACARFIEDIYWDLMEPHIQYIKAAKFLSVLVDASTDTSTRDLISVYIRHTIEGHPTNTFVSVEQLQHCHAEGYTEAIDRALQSIGLGDWKLRTVGFGSDGAAVMVGRKSGVATRLRADIPWLLNVQCLAHGLELAAMDAIKSNQSMKRIDTMLRGLFKQYQYSPKAWRELQDVADALQVKVWKPTNLSGTRWLPHIERALSTVLKNFQPLSAHLQHTAEANSASAEMIGRAKQASSLLKDHRQLLYMHFVLDILETLSSLSLKLQADSMTLPKLMLNFETTLLTLTSFRTTYGEHLESYLQISEMGMFDGVTLINFSQEETDAFHRSKLSLLHSITSALEARFSCLETNHLLKAAAKLMDPREWPENQEDLVTFGNAELNSLSTHFGEILTKNGCNLSAAMRREWIKLKTAVKRLPLTSQKPEMWEQFLADEDRMQEFPNLMMIMHILLVIPISTASCERGFSSMKRIKNDWRSKLNTSTLSKLMYISIEGPDLDDYNCLRALQRWWEEKKRNPSGWN